MLSKEYQNITRLRSKHSKSKSDSILQKCGQIYIKKSKEIKKIVLCEYLKDLLRNFINFWKFPNDVV